MLGEFLGFRELDFSDKDGKPVKGLQLCIAQNDNMWHGSTIITSGKTAFPFVPYGTDLYNKLIREGSEMLGQAVEVELISRGGKLGINDVKIPD